MRNLKQYPITVPEVCTALQNAQNKNIKERNPPGTTDGVSLLLAEQFILENAGLFEQFVLSSPMCSPI